MAARTTDSELELASRIMTPILRDVEGDLCHAYSEYAPPGKSIPTSVATVFNKGGIIAFSNYLLMMSDYGRTLQSVAPPVGDAMFVIIGEVAGAHRRVMKQYPRAKRDGLSLTQVFEKHPPAVGLFLNHIAQVQTSPQLSDNWLVKVGLEAQKSAFIID